MKGRSWGISIGRYFGIEFHLDFSWFLMGAIVTASLTTDFFPYVQKGQTTGVYLAMGLSGAFLFFLSILLHELGHSIVSQRCGIPVPRITLMFIGGVAEIAREPDDARSELKIALGGPAVSVLLIGIYAGLSQLFNWLGWASAQSVCFWLTWANAFLVLFNMIPGYPLDGGRVLRALLWARSGKLRQSTFITSRIGIGFSWLLMAWGFYAILHQQWSAITFFLIAFFLKTAAESGYASAVERELLGGVQVRDIMTKDPRWIPASFPINLAVDEYFLNHHHDAFPVCHDDLKFLGMLRLDLVRKLPRKNWPYTSAGDFVARNAEALSQINASEPASRAMRYLASPGHTSLAVIEDGKLTGIITRSDIRHIIEIRTQLET